MRATIGTTDYAVLGVSVLLSLCIGLYYAVKERTKTSAFRYHLAGGKLKALPVALSLLVTFQSSIFFLGYPSEVYTHGFIYWWALIGTYIGFTSVLWISIPLFYSLKITSVYEYLEIRYGASDIRRFATCLSCLSNMSYAGVVLYGAGTALDSVTGIPTWVFIVGMTAISVLYTALGGLKAVIATDVVQAIVLIAAIAAIVIKGTIEVGGISKVIATNQQSGRTKLLYFDPDPMIRHTFWTLFIGKCINSVYLAFQQPTVQRLNSTCSRQEAKKVMWIALPCFIIIDAVVLYEGLLAYAYFDKKGCDPLAAGLISNPNQIIPYTVMDMFRTTKGVSGLFLGALASASLSTISSILGSVSAVLSEDVVKHYWAGLSDMQLTRISKIIVLLTGLICGFIAILIGYTKGPLTQISNTIVGALLAPMTALFLMTIFVRFATRKGMMIGVCVGLLFGGWISAGYNFSPGRKVTPWLPLGPTDRCFGLNNTGISFNISMSSAIHSRDMYNITATTSIPSGTQQSTEPIITGLDRLYSISYCYFPAMIMFVTIVVGLTSSLLTRPKIRRAVPDHLMLSISTKHMCCFQKREKPDQAPETVSMCDL